MLHHQFQALINSVVSQAQSTEAVQQAYYQETAYQGRQDRAGMVGSSSNHPQSMASDITGAQT